MSSIGNFKSPRATYMRLTKDNSWGLRIDGDCSPGMTVEVVRKDGQIRSAIIGKIVWQKDGVFGATIASAEEAERLAARPKQEFDAKMHRVKSRVPIPPDDGTIPFDPPYAEVLS